MTTINWLTLYKEIITVYYENHTKHINTPCGNNAVLLIVKAGVSYILLLLGSKRLIVLS
jgi:hypothetical protein